MVLWEPTVVKNMRVWAPETYLWDYLVIRRIQAGEESELLPKFAGEI